VGAGEPSDKVVRLRLIGAAASREGEGDDRLRDQMLSRIASWEQARGDARPVWLDDIGLEPDEVDQLRSEGAPLHVLRGLGRRLREDGRERTLEAYRDLLADVDDAD
jgi:hypothetical protein